MKPDIEPARFWIFDRSRIATLEEIGDPEFMADLMQDFVRNFELCLSELTQALGAKNTTKISRLCHSTRSSAANLGATTLVTVCDYLSQIAAGAAVDWNLLKSIVTDLERSTPYLRDAVAQYLPRVREL